MHPIDLINSLRSNYPRAKDRLTPDNLTLIALDHALKTKHKLTVMQRAHIFNQAYKPDIFNYNRVVRLGLSRCDLRENEQYKLIETEIIETI